jgi:hypothetical protein
MMTGPTELDPYFAELVARLTALLGAELVGVYVGGSYALGDYTPGRSDLDVAVVTRESIANTKRTAIVAALRHESLPCPARGLELVVYPLDAVRAGTAEAGFDLNLNSGSGMQFRVDYEPDAAEAHWFAIDRSILATHGVALVGPPAGDVFADVESETLLPVLVQSLRWHADGAARGDDAVLNACRTLRYASERRWSPKREAGKWALRRVDDTSLIEEALAARSDDRELDRDRVSAFLAHAIAEVKRKL